MASDLAYISPEAMAICLSSLTPLEQLTLPRPNRVILRPPPPTRTVLPVLTSSSFKGTGEYLGHLFAHIDPPRLKDVDIVNFPNPAMFDVSQISQFNARTETFEEAHMLCNRDFVDVILSSSKGTTGGPNAKTQFG